MGAQIMEKLDQSQNVHTKARKTFLLTEMHCAGWDALNQTKITGISSHSYDKVLGN